MPTGIDKSDWDLVHQMACDVANAAIMKDDVLMASKNAAMLYLLSTLRAKYGEHPSILATIGDYLDDPAERKTMYLMALSIAKDRADQKEVAEITDSLKGLDE